MVICNNFFMQPEYIQNVFDFKKQMFLTEYKEESKIKFELSSNGALTVFINGSIDITEKTYQNSWFGWNTINPIDIKNTIEEHKDSITELILDFESPGGIATGIPELADYIFNLPMKTIARTRTIMCSAAYYLAAACKTIQALPTAKIGSIGTYVAIYKHSPDRERHVHVFTPTRSKLFGHPDLPISQKEIDFYTNSVTKTNDLFWSDVCKYRNIDKSVLENLDGIAQEAMFMPAEIVDELIKL